MAIPDEKWILVESGPIAGLEPTTTFHDTMNAALIYHEPRKAAFSRFDLGEVKFRRFVELVVQATDLRAD